LSQDGPKSKNCLKIVCEFGSWTPKEQVAESTVQRGPIIPSLKSREMQFIIVAMLEWCCSPRRLCRVDDDNDADE